MISDRLMVALTCGFLLAAACGRAGGGGSQPPEIVLPPAGPLTWPVLSAGGGGAVSAMAVADDGTVYVGGTFKRVGPMSGGGVPLGAASGQPAATFPKVDGVVQAVTPDGSGGWYIGGYFTRVGGEPRENLAHVLADGSLDPSWAPGVRHSVWDSYVMALAFDGGILYVAGVFDTLGGEPRSGLGAVDASGQVTAWAPKLSSGPYVSTVSALAARGSTIVLGGDFDAVNGEARSCLAAVDTAGTLTAWNPGAGAAAWRPQVAALAMMGDTVYVAGFFESVAGEPREGLAAVDAAGAATAWHPALGAYSMYGAWATVLAAGDGTLYVGGTFESVGGYSRSGLAAFDASGALTSWNPVLDIPRVHALAVSRGVVYVGGSFERAGGLARSRLAAFDASGAPTSWDPDVDDEGLILALAASVDGVYAGGTFRWVGKASNRVGLAAVDPSGRVTDWNPGVEGSTSGSTGSVHALAVVAGTVYVGGDFARVGGAPRSNLAAVDAAGAATSWNPGASGPVYALTSGGDTIYVGGRFGMIGGKARGNLAAVNASGEVTAWSPQANAFITSLAVEGETIYAGGYFTAVNSKARSNVAAVRVDGTLLPWSPRFADAAGFAGPSGASHPPTGVWALAVSGTTVYASGDFGTVGGVTRPRLAALDASGEPTSFQVWLDALPARGLAIGEGTLLAGGSFGRTYSAEGSLTPALAIVSLGSAGTSSYRSVVVSYTSTKNDPNSPYGTPYVDAIVVRDGVVYVGGRIWGRASGPDRRWNLAALDARGETLGWDPNAFP